MSYEGDTCTVCKKEIVKGQQGYHNFLYHTTMASDMTLRQHYAGLAMQALIYHRIEEGLDSNQIANLSFIHADAMIRHGANQ